ncbi:MAG: class I SAM-dependent methyltransferase [Alphaproteobacteria bacterium]
MAPEKFADRSIDLCSLQEKVFGCVNVIHRSCPLCGDENRATPPSRYSLGRWTVKACRNCGFTYIDSAPEYEALVQHVSWEKSSQIEKQWRETTRTVQQSISKKTRWRMRLLPRKNMPDMLKRYADPGNVVDLGCGDGGHLEGLESSFIPHGIEISREAAIKANARFDASGGHAVNAPCLEGLREFPAEFFTAATLRSYLEHESRPAEVLTELHRVLKPGGIAVVKVPNFASLNRRVMERRWCGFRHPDHLNYFTPATLRAMATKSGFEAWFGLTWRMPTSDNMWALLRRRLASAWLFIIQSLGAGHGVAEMALAF